MKPDSPLFSLKRLFLSSCHEQDQTRFVDTDGVGHQSFLAGNKLAKIVCDDTSAPLTDHNDGGCYCPCNWDKNVKSVSVFQCIDVFN